MTTAATATAPAARATSATAALALMPRPKPAADKALNIGEAAARSGVPAKTIRFYEAEGVLPPAARTASGYRQYSENDVRRLRLIRRLRALGLPLDAVRLVADGAFAAECRDYVRDIGTLLDTQCAEIDRKVDELLALRRDLGALADQARAVAPHVPSGRRVESCGECLVVDGPELGQSGALGAPGSPHGGVPAGRRRRRVRR